MDTSPNGERAPGSGYGSAPGTPPRGPATSPTTVNRPPPSAPPRVPPQANPPPPHVAVPPPTRRPSRTTVWVPLGASMASGVIAVLLGVSLLGNSTETPTQDTTGGEPTDHLGSGLDRPPPPLEIDVERHPLYQTSPPAEVGCDLPDLDTSSPEFWESFSVEVGGCLDELWQPHLEDLGVSSETPTVQVTEENPDQSGQEGMTLAYYEGEELSITVVVPNVLELSEDIPEGRTAGVLAALLGHEYGHHVQQVTGLLDAATELEQQAPSQSAELQELRRTELQAECLGGMAMRGFDTFDGTELDAANAFLNGGDDLPTHGSARNRQHWFDQGRAAETIAECNTYEAEASLVR